jgi:hypothetical protein
MHIGLNRDWSFTERFDEAFARGEGTFDAVDLPHTCKQTPFDYFDESIYQMVCGYRRVLHVPRDFAGKRAFLTVGAAGHSAEVYVDGKKLGEHHCGYTAFTIELTEALTPGKDALLVIRVDTREQQDIPPFGYVIDYMTYGGLYREVWLDVYEGALVEDVCVRPAIPDGAGLVKKRDNARAIAAVFPAAKAPIRTAVCVTLKTASLRLTSTGNTLRDAPVSQAQLGTKAQKESAGESVQGSAIGSPSSCKAAVSPP